MNCSDFRQALDDALDRSAALSGEARAHAGTCRDGACRVAWEDFQLIGAAVRAVPAAESPELVERVLASLPLSTRPAARTEPEGDPRRLSRSTALNLVMVMGVLVAAVLGLVPRPGPGPVPVAKQDRPARGAPSRVVATAVEPIIPLHLAARAPALLTDTVNGRFDREAIRDLPVVTPLMSAVTETFRPMGQELEEWVRQFEAAPDETMDNSTQIPVLAPPVT